MEIVSVHVPKTGGHAFCNVLVHHYGLERIVKDYDNIDIRTIGPEHRVVHGHFGVAKYHGLFPTARRIAWVRHPVSWVISFYYYSKSVHHQAVCPVNCRLHTEQLSLEEFAEHPSVRNIVTRQYLYGLDLEEFFFVGIQEEFDEDLGDLARMMGWPEVRTGVDNANPEPGYRGLVRRHWSDRALIRRLERLNEADMEYYERARSLRARRRLAAQGSGGRPDADRPAGSGSRIFGTVRGWLRRGA
jgi:hypothetical protein